jgi:MFS superfamily sulfate permease-like transporter
MTTTALAGVNIYSVIGLLVAASLFFHFTSKEETIMMVIAAVAIVYILFG